MGRNLSIRPGVAGLGRPSWRRIPDEVRPVTLISGGITTHDEITESFSVQNAVSNNFLIIIMKLLFVVKLFL